MLGQNAVTICHNLFNRQPLFQTPGQFDQCRVRFFTGRLIAVHCSVTDDDDDGLMTDDDDDGLMNYYYNNKPATTGSSQ